MVPAADRGDDDDDDDEEDCSLFPPFLLDHPVRGKKVGMELRKEETICLFGQ